MVRGICWIPACGIVFGACTGDVEVPSQLGALPVEVASEHQAPDAAGNCTATNSQTPESWTVEVEIADDESPFMPTVVDVGVDACGGVAIAWRGYQATAKHMSVARVLPDGQLDWEREFSYRLGYDGLLDLVVDDFGNSVVLAGGSLRVLAADGETYSDVPDEGYEFLEESVDVGEPFVERGAQNLSAVVRTETGWLVAGHDLWHVFLPFGEVDWYVATESLDTSAQPASLLVGGEGEVLHASRRIEDDGSWVFVQQHTIDVDEQEASPSMDTEDVVVAHSDGFADAPLIASVSGHTFLGVSHFWRSHPADQPPAEGTCMDVQLGSIADEDVAADLDFCGGLQDLVARSDGSLLSLWALGARRDDEGRVLDATLLLLETDAEGDELQRWDLADAVGPVGQEVHGAAAMALTKDGDALVIAGKSTERGVLTMHRLPLEDGP